MSDERLADIRERAEKAAPGPWKAFGNEYVVQVSGKDDMPYILFARDGTGRLSSVVVAYAMRDAEFVAHAREDIPALLAEVDRLRQRVEWLEEEKRQLLVVGQALGEKIRQYQMLRGE